MVGSKLGPGPGRQGQIDPVNSKMDPEFKSAVNKGRVLTKLRFGPIPNWIRTSLNLVWASSKFRPAVLENSFRIRQ